MFALVGFCEGRLIGKIQQIYCLHKVLFKSYRIEFTQSFSPPSSGISRLKFWYKSLQSVIYSEVFRLRKTYDDSNLSLHDLRKVKEVYVK
jgi:hypothetical protein